MPIPRVWVDVGPPAWQNLDCAAKSTDGRSPCSTRAARWAWWRRVTPNGSSRTNGAFACVRTSNPPKGATSKSSSVKRRPPSRSVLVQPGIFVIPLTNSPYTPRIYLPATLNPLPESPESSVVSTWYLSDCPNKLRHMESGGYSTAVNFRR